MKTNLYRLISKDQKKQFVVESDVDLQKIKVLNFHNLKTRQETFNINSFIVCSDFGIKDSFDSTVFEGDILRELFGYETLIANKTFAHQVQLTGVEFDPKIYHIVGNVNLL